MHRRPFLPYLFPLVTIIAVVMLTVASSSPARACSCQNDSKDRPIFPVGHEDVPTNTSLWTFGMDPLFQSLYFAGRRLEPELVVTTRSRHQLRRWALDTVLEPGSSHTAMEVPCVAGMCPLFTFTVGDGPATRPAIPTITSAIWREEDSDSCSESAFYTLAIDSPANTIVLVALRRPGSLPPSLPSDADMVAVPSFHPSGRRAIMTIGKMACGGTNWDFGIDDSVPLHVGALDPAGFFSGWSERHTLEAPACSGGAPSTGLAAAFLVLVALRRRGHHPHAR